jgi:tryptophan 2,3-dioxygenase
VTGPPSSVSYQSYLKLDTLLSLQEPLSEYQAAEQMFIIVHQVYELWFKQGIAQLESAIGCLNEDRIGEALFAIRQLTSIDRLMVEQIVLLERQNPRHFAAIRRHLGSASGAQSTQYRRLEQLSGGPPARDGASAEPGLWTATCQLIARTGMAMPAGAGTDDEARRVRTVCQIYASDARDDVALRLLLEALLNHDESFALFRWRHAMTAGRQLGSVSGTGGSAGREYLERRTLKRFYPELWDVRSFLTDVALADTPRVGTARSGAGQ